MLIHSLKKSLFYIPIAVIFLLFTSHVWVAGPLIVPHQMSGFMDSYERMIPILLVAFCSLILPDKYEIELALVCGVRMTRLFMSKAVPMILYTVIPANIILCFYKYIPYDYSQIKPVIPIYIPENFMLYVAVSLFVTMVFFLGLFLFFRVITRDCYIPLFICLFVFSLFKSFSYSIKNGTKSILNCIVDPFISTYILGDELPNAFASQIDGMEIMRNAWTYNRIGFFVIGIIFLVLTYIFLLRERLHVGLGE